MKIPESPPNFDDLFQKLITDSPDKFREIVSMGIKADPKGKYYHWDKLKYLKKVPNEISHKEWWLGIKFARRTLYKPLPHIDKYGEPFFYAEPDCVRRLLHNIDIHGGGEIMGSEQIANPHTRDTYLINSLIEESITSSQLEGASTTRKIAKEMLRAKRKPRDNSEKMIFNNYNAMEFIRENADEDLTPDIICALHKIVTEGTLENEEAEGRFRKRDDIIVGDALDPTVVLHEPPLAKELPKRLNNLCDFANSKSDATFLPPVLKAILLHFFLAYDHPFEDGNGRTARALFYWSMLRQNYWAMEYVSISRILKNAPAKYKRSYLYTETDDNDATYFIMYQLEVIVRSINELFEYFNKKTQEIKKVESIINKSPELQRILNYRQIALLNRALKKPNSIYYVESHRGAHNVTYDTARTDLLKLVDLGLLDKTKIGKAFAFSPVENFRVKLENLDH